MLQLRQSTCLFSQLLSSAIGMRLEGRWRGREPVDAPCSYQRRPSSSWLFQEQLVPVSNLLLTPRTRLLGTSLVYQHQMSCRLWVPASLSAFSKLLDPNGLNFFTLFPTLRMVIAVCVYYLCAILVPPISLFQLSHTCLANSLCSGIC